MQPPDESPSPRTRWRRPFRTLPGARPALVALLVGLATVLCAATLPRDVLWGVESTCILNYRATGASFPCVEVNLARGAERGYAVLRAPFRRTHLVAMPTARVIGIETSVLRDDDAPNYFEDAWASRRHLEAVLRRPLAWNDAGLAVNSRVTRSQDQLHIHIDCVLPRVKTALSQKLLGQVPTDRWQEAGYTFQGQSYWTRLVDKPSLEGVNAFRLASEIPALRDRASLTTLAVVGVTDAGGRNGFMLLAGQSEPSLAARQSTGEDLLDHSCRVLR